MAANGPSGPSQWPFNEISLFTHDLTLGLSLLSIFILQAFSLHVFAKRPIEAITKLGDFRRAIMKRIALAALQIRLSVNSRADPPYLSVEFNQLDSPREVGFSAVLFVVLVFLQQLVYRRLQYVVPSQSRVYLIGWSYMYLIRVPAYTNKPL